MTTHDNLIMTSHTRYHGMTSHTRYHGMTSHTISWQYHDNIMTISYLTISGATMILTLK